MPRIISRARGGWDGERNPAVSTSSLRPRPVAQSRWRLIDCAPIAHQTTDSHRTPETNRGTGSWSSLTPRRAARRSRSRSFASSRSIQRSTTRRAITRSCWRTGRWKKTWWFPSRPCLKISRRAWGRSGVSGRRTGPRHRARSNASAILDSTRFRFARSRGARGAREPTSDGRRPPAAARYRPPRRAFPACAARCPGAGTASPGSGSDRSRCSSRRAVRARG